MLRRVQNPQNALAILGILGLIFFENIHFFQQNPRYAHKYHFNENPQNAHLK